MCVHYFAATLSSCLVAVGVKAFVGVTVTRPTGRRAPPAPRTLVVNSAQTQTAAEQLKKVHFVPPGNTKHFVHFKHLLFSGLDLETLWIHTHKVKSKHGTKRQTAHVKSKEQKKKATDIFFARVKWWTSKGNRNKRLHLSKAIMGVLKDFYCFLFQSNHHKDIFILKMYLTPFILCCGDRKWILDAHLRCAWCVSKNVLSGKLQL